MNLNLRTLSIVLFVVLLALLMVVIIDAEAQGRKPNIILIMADDLGYETLECNGGKSYRTPNLNAMARSGMRFENVHATPLCTPSRVQLMTGKYNFRNYVGFGILDPSELTFAHLLKDAGYVTGITGKWQLLGLKEEQDAVGGRRGSYPFEAGFDEYCLWQVEERLSRYKDPVITTNGNRQVEMKGAYGPDVFSSFAKDFIERHRDESFFLYYPMVLVHDPFQPTPENPAYHDMPADSKGDPRYFGEMVSYMDKIVGELIKKVKEAGIADNTLIIFVGDNGTSNEITSRLNDRMVQGGKSGHRYNATHVPMIALWQGVIAPGAINTNLIDFTDFLPTFLDLAEVSKPRYFFADGVSFYNQLKGKPNPAVREWVFCSYDPKRGKRIPGTWIHDKEWKLYQTGEFYHLAKDPDEKNPLTADRMDAAATHARTRLERAMHEVLSKR
jgi:arylsulfatase A